MTIDTDPELSPYLQGNYAPIHDEVDVADLVVHGEIPAGLNGVFMRNGANQAFPPLGRYHVFDGDGMVHAVYLEEGRARYRNRFVESRGLLAEREAGHALFGGLSNFVLPDPDTMAKVGMMKNTANTNIIRHAGRYLALMEAALPTELTRELDTIGEHDFGGALTGAMTAHPKWDPTTGELVFFGYAPFPPYVRVHVANRDGELTSSVDVDLPKPVMMHDFVVTAEHVVLFDLPAVFDVHAMMNGGPGISWQPDNGARIGVLRRDATDSSSMVWIEVDPFYVFHFLNAFDRDATTIVVDGCRAPRLPVAFGDDEVTGPATPMLHRWTIDLTTATIAEEQLDDRGGDFPRVNMQHEGQQHRYGYIATTEAWGDTVQFNGVTKYDLESGSSSAHSYGDNVDTGEVVFASDPDGTAEDDGWLLTFANDHSTGISSLVILDAHDLTAEPVARIDMPHRVPFGFHGNWMPEPR